MKSLKTMFVLSLAALSPALAQASITITSNFTKAFADDGNGIGNTTNFTETAIPPLVPAFDASDGDSYSNNTANWSQSGGQTILSFDMDHRRSAASFSTVRTQNVDTNGIVFKANANEPFELSGFYRVTDDGDFGGDVFQIAVFSDVTAGSTLLFNYLGSRFEKDVEFTLGQESGNMSFPILGSLSGMLTAGNSYQLLFLNSVTNSLDFGEANAVGNLTLTIGKNGTVPEPLSLLVWGCLIVGAVAVRRLRTVP